MARKSKRMALYEAIQQGQVKIAEGLKTGRMRSDAPGAHAPEPDKKPPVESEVTPTQKMEYQRGVYKETKSVSLTPKTVLTGIGIVLIIAIFAVGYWIGTGRSGNEGTGEDGSLTGSGQDLNGASGTNRPGRGIGFWAGSDNDEDEADQDTDDQNKTDELKQPVEQTGSNVIVIASANKVLKDELIKVSDFFKEKGIETEIIPGNSGYLILVTKAGFEKNPQNQGTLGNRLLQQIKQYGLTYPEETGDTQWGRTAAFQDAYGYNKEKN